MAFADQVNRGSLRTLADKTGRSLANRFNGQVRAHLPADWAGESAPVREMIGELLSMMGPEITVHMMDALGYQYDPSTDGGFVSVTADSDEPA